MNTEKSVVIADDDAELVGGLTYYLKSLGLNVRPASDDLDVLAKVLKDWPNLLIIDIDRPSGNGFGVIERILQETKMTPFTETVILPVIVLTHNSDANTIRECEVLGVRYVLKDTHIWAKLKPLICELVKVQDNKGMETAKANLPVSPEQPVAGSSLPKVLVVDDDPDIIKAIKIRLECHGLEIVAASNGMQGYQIALKIKPDLIITDYTMPEGGGDHMLVRLKQNSVTQKIPVIVLTGRTIEGHKDVALERDMTGRRGAAAFFTKPVNFDQLLDEMRRHITLSAFTRVSAVALS